MRAVSIITVSLLTLGTVHAREGDEAKVRPIWIGLENGTEAEATMATELRGLLRTYDLEPWILTRKILIDQNAIPHSHQVLTIDTGRSGGGVELLSTFVHEQLHWLEEEPWLSEFRAAMAEFETMFPDVPSSSDGGARDDQSTYRHLLVCDMEYQALSALVGEAAAREALLEVAHYEWIYRQVLNDPRIREVTVRHGFDVSTGVPKRGRAAISALPNNALQTDKMLPTV